MIATSKVLLVTAACLAATGLAACGSGSDNRTLATSDYNCSDPNAATSTDIRLVGMPILSNAAIFVGVDKGIFERHGLKPTVEMVASPPAGISALMGGSADFGFTSTINLVQSVSQGQPIRGVASFAGVEPGFYEKMKAGEAGYERGINALLVDGDSGIKSAVDLEGKTVAITDPAFAKLLVSTWMRENGGDPDKVKFVILDAAASYAAVEAGKVDAAHSLEPFINGFEDAGMENLAWLEVEAFKDGAPMSFMVATEDFINTNPDTVARFNCAISESAEYSNAHPEELRNATAREQKVDPSTLADQLVPWFFPSIDRDGVDLLQEAMVDNGLLDKPLPLDGLMAPVVLQNAATQ